jgi:hypothetical protein
MSKKGVFFLIVACVIAAPVHAQGMSKSRPDVDKVYRTCMSQYPGGWRSEAEWSDRCVEIADGPRASANRARLDYYLGSRRRAEVDRRRCIEDPQIVNTSRCIRDAEVPR